MGNLEDGEYYITINHTTLVNPKPYGISEYQVNTPFSQELMEDYSYTFNDDSYSEQEKHDKNTDIKELIAKNAELKNFIARCV